MAPTSQVQSGVVRRWQRLMRSSKARRTEQQFAIEGVRSLLHAVESGFRVRAVICCRKLQQNWRVRRLLRELEDVPVAHVGPAAFRQISRLPRASGIAAIVEMKTVPLGYVFEEPNCPGFALAVTRMRSSGNLGTLLRTAAAAGCAGLIVIGNELDPFDPDSVRASMGAVFRVPIVRTTWDRFTDWQEQNTCQVVGAHPSAIQDYDGVEYAAPSVLMLGEERRGLSSRQKQACDHLVRIPMVSGTDSLNVSVAGSLIMYQMRQGIAPTRKAHHE